MCPLPPPTSLHTVLTLNLSTQILCCLRRALGSPNALHWLFAALVSLSSALGVYILRHATRHSDTRLYRTSSPQLSTSAHGLPFWNYRLGLGLFAQSFAISRLMRGTLGRHPDLCAPIAIPLLPSRPLYTILCANSDATHHPSRLSDSHLPPSRALLHIRYVLFLS